MAGPENKSFGEINGERARNIGLVLVVAGLFASGTLVFVGGGLAGAGEIWRRTSKPKK